MLSTPNANQIFFFFKYNNLSGIFNGEVIWDERTWITFSSLVSVQAIPVLVAWSKVG